MQLQPDVQSGLLMCQSVSVTVSQCVSPSVVNFFWQLSVQWIIPSWESSFHLEIQTLTVFLDRWRKASS